jgi:hypothetical protein
VAYLGSSGIVLGETDSEGVEWAWTGDDPWSPSPAPREVAGDRENGHGQWDATEFYQHRTLQVTGQAEGSHEALHAAQWRLGAAVTAGLFPFRVVDPSGDREAMVRRGGDVLWTEETTGRVAWSLSLRQPDPLVRSTALRSLPAMGLPATSGGLTAPFDAPFSVPATVTTGAGTVVNAGNEWADSLLTLTGPLQDAVITQPSTGVVMRLQNPGGALLGSGDTLVLDSASERVMLGGVTSRKSWLVGAREFIRFPPRSSEVRWGSSTGTAGTLTVAWRDTWI